MKQSIKSIKHSKRNSDDHEEMTIVYEKTLLQKFFGRKETVRKYVCIDGDWYDSETNKKVSQSMWFMLEQIESKIRCDYESTNAPKHKSTRRHMRNRTTRTKCQ